MIVCSSTATAFAKGFQYFLRPIDPLHWSPQPITALAKHCRIRNSNSDDVYHFRWDHAPLGLYYEQTRLLLQPILEELSSLEERHFSQHEKLIECADELYYRVVNVLQMAANLCIPKCKKGFLKFWWSQELDTLKQSAIDSCKLWKEAGKPKFGPIYNNYKRDKLQYKRRIKDEQKRETLTFTNDLHDALLRKSGHDFWKVWKSKFEANSDHCVQIDGTSDCETIAVKFANFFQKVCTPYSDERNDEFRAQFINRRSAYDVPLANTDKPFSVESLSYLLSKMKNGKAPGLDDLSCEHLKYSHPIIVTVLCKLFNIFILNGCVPTDFGKSYMVPIAKSNAHNRSLTVEDFRGISISPVISKLFEHAVLDRFAHLFITSDNQLGFKKNLSCMHAIYTVRSVVNYYTQNGSTVNVCSLDLSKAFDKMNHYALLNKLMDRKFPNEILNILQQWFSVSFTCVKWMGYVSHFFSLSAGVRQGGVLSPFLFAIFVDSLVDKVRATGVGCYFKSACVSVLLYADDILLISPSVTALQILLNACAEELSQLDMRVNVNKSLCIRFGRRYNVDCACPLLSNDEPLKWVNQCRYLGVYFVSGHSFKCSFDHSKKQYFKAFNAIFSKVGRFASEEVVISLLRAKCVPVLLYGVEACPVLARDKQSLGFTVTRSFMKLFRTGSANVVTDCQKQFKFLPVNYLIDIRTTKFLEKLTSSENLMCSLFVKQATDNMLNIFSKYGNDIKSSKHLSDIIDRTFFGV